MFCSPAQAMPARTGTDCTTAPPRIHEARGSLEVQETYGKARYAGVGDLAKLVKHGAKHVVVRLVWQPLLCIQECVYVCGHTAGEYCPCVTASSGGESSSKVIAQAPLFALLCSIIPLRCSSFCADQPKQRTRRRSASPNAATVFFLFRGPWLRLWTPWRSHGHLHSRYQSVSCLRGGTIGLALPKQNKSASAIPHRRCGRRHCAAPATAP